MNEPNLLPEILTLVGSTTVVATFFHYLKLPTIIGFIMAGVIVGPFGLGLVGTVPGAEFLTEVGIVFLMFTTGLEFSVKKLKNLRKAFFGLGLGQIILSFTVVAFTCQFVFAFSWPKAAFFGYLVALSSTAIVIKLLQDARELSSPYGNASLGILLCQDLAIIPMMLSLPLLSSVTATATPVSLQLIYEWGLKILAIVVGLGVADRFIVPFCFEQIVKTKSRELFFFAVLLLCFGIGFIMEKAGLSFSFGAFLAGLLIADSPYGRQATSDIMPLRDNFLGLFFTSVGMLVDLKFLTMNAHWILLLVLMLVVIKVGVVYGLGRLFKYPDRISIITAFMVFQIGEFSFVLAGEGQKIGLINANENQFFLAVSVISMMLTPFVFKWAPAITFSEDLEKFRQIAIKDVPKGILRVIANTVTEKTLPPRKLSEATNASSHTIIIGFGVAGRNIADVLKKLNIPHAIIEQNFEVVQKQKKLGEKIFFGDASRHEILDHVGIRGAKLVVIAVSGVEMTRAIVFAVRSARPDVDLVIRVQYSAELQGLPKISKAAMVVAEYETTIELIARALIAYGVPSNDIQTFMAQTREKLQKSTSSLSDQIRSSIDLPAWQAISSIRPLRLKDTAKGAGNSLENLQIRALTGATVVAVYREGLGSAIPGGDFVLQAGDILHMLGDIDAFQKAEELLN